MIEEITLENFQSHKNTELKLHPGVNVFTGNSDCGKSAIMRGLIWCITNTPGGDSFISTWAKDSKGKQKKQCSVTIDSCSRLRGVEFNGYQCEENAYEALRGAVPESVQKYLNLGSVNIQHQLDGPFMLSNTPGENARLVNELVNLTDIDTASSWIASEKRDCSSREKMLTKDIQDLEKKVKNADEISTLISRIERLDFNAERIGQMEDKHQRCEQLLREFHSIKTYDTEALSSVLGTLESLLVRGQQLRKLADDVQGSINEFHTLSKKVCPDIDINKLERKMKLVNELLCLHTETKTKLEEYRSLEITLTRNSYEMRDLMTELSTMACPMCGRTGHLGCI